LRVRPVDETLALAREIGRDVGVVRVTDTTRLDRIGVPVFASVRPIAHPASLHVSAGKGQTPAEAEAGAWMEAIELAYAEPERAAVTLRRALAREVLDGEIDRLSRLRGIGPIAPDTPIVCVDATDVATGATLLVPAELALYPATLSVIGQARFGSDGNGLASGNSLDEATAHGVTEAIERDVLAFHFTRDRSRRVTHETLPPSSRELAARLDELGFDLILRTEDNPFGIAWFKALLAERNVRNALHVGFGASLVAEIALTRAICEAVQSRLTVIHGARDDLKPFLPHDSDARLAKGAVEIAALAADPHACSFADVPSVAVDTISDALAILVER
jgi:ribosomal protein S12 methylthiotransferase accessory factor